MAVLFALGATVATSPARWSVDAPAPAAVTDVLSAADPRSEIRLQIDGSPELTARKVEARWSFGLRAEARWVGASEGAQSSVLHVDYEGIQAATTPSTPATAVDIVLRPDEPVTFEASSPWETECGETCSFVMGAKLRWDQPDGRLEIRWLPHASANGFVHGRRSEPKKSATITVKPLP